MSFRPHLFITACICICGADFQRNKPLSRTVAITLCEIGGTTKKNTLFPIDPTVYGGYARCVSLGEFGRSDADAFFHPRRERRVETALSDAFADAGVLQNSA